MSDGILPAPVDAAIDSGQCPSEGFPTESEWKSMTCHSSTFIGPSYLQAPQPPATNPGEPSTAAPAAQPTLENSADSASPSQIKPVNNSGVAGLLRLLDAYSPPLYVNGARMSSPAMHRPKTGRLVQSQQLPYHAEPPSTSTLVSLIPPAPPSQWPPQKDVQRLRDACMRQNHPLQPPKPNMVPYTTTFGNPGKNHHRVTPQHATPQQISLVTNNGVPHILVAVPVPYAIPAPAPQPPSGHSRAAETIWSPGPSPSSSSEVLSYQTATALNSNNPANLVDPTKYKTSLCRNFELQGICPYGEVCVYAHGESELRNVTENSVAVQSLCKLADQLANKLGPVSLHSLGPLRYRKKKNKKAGFDGSGKNSSDPTEQHNPRQPKMELAYF